MFAKLKDFAREHGHCKVPKGYHKDIELANWVRNQRLEYTNMQRKKKTRMTEERLQLLNSIGFTWSTPAASKKLNVAAEADDKAASRSAGQEKQDATKASI